jgi:hypothetical protein
VDLYATIARKHLTPSLGRLALDRIRPSGVEALIITKPGAGRAPSTRGARRRGARRAPPTTCLPADDERDQHLADAVTFDVDVDGQGTARRSSVRP